MNTRHQNNALGLEAALLNEGFKSATAARMAKMYTGVTVKLAPHYTPGDYIVHLLNRKTAYSIVDYARKLRKAYGAALTLGQIVFTLESLDRADRIAYIVVDGTVFGKAIK